MRTSSDPDGTERPPSALHKERILREREDPNWIAVTEYKDAEIDPAKAKDSTPFEDADLSCLWNEGIEVDGEYRDIKKALLHEERCFPPSVTCKISISECKIDRKGNFKWRDRLLIPEYEPLQTALIHNAHDSPVTGHPGCDSTLSILSRDFYRPKISNMVRRFVRNCDVCGRTHVWRDEKRGFLKTLPVPDRFHQELSIDFMVDRPADKEQPRYLIVITDRL
ncbi:hypothetical protein K3495_g6749 [Podosphaera aphanis]|nr:hypothetical protein K3495_g6749 [Podosphaera aphanis]